MTEQSAPLTIELRLDRDGTEKFFIAQLDGLALTTTTGKLGQKGRTTQKTLKSAQEASKAFAKAVTKKKKAGFFPMEEGYGDPLDLDAKGPVVRAAKLKVRATPVKNGNSLSPRNNPPIQLDKMRSDLGWGYADGPGEWGLWSPGRLQVGRRHEIRDVEPLLEGKLEYTLYPQVFEGFAFRPDGNGMLLVRENTLLELDLPTATATVRHTFADAKGAFSVLPFYAGDGTTAVWRDGRSLVAKPAKGEAQPVFEAKSKIVDATTLHGGGTAVLTQDACTILDASWQPTHEMPVRKGFSLGTWLDGRLLLVSMDLRNEARATVFFAVDDTGGLHECHQSKRTVQDAFDLRGCQWMTQKDRSHGRVYNADLVYAAALELPAIGSDHVISLAPLHDFIAAAHNAKPKQVTPVIGALKAVPARLEMRGVNARSTPLGYAAGWFGSVPITNALLKAGATVDVFDINGDSPLAAAFAKGHLDTAELLIDAGAKGAYPFATTTVEGKEVAVEAPIVVAAGRGYFDAVKRLLEAGTDPNARGRNGTTAVGAALTGKHSELAEFLMAQGATASGLDAVKAVVKSADVALARRIIPAAATVIREGDTGSLLCSALLSLTVKSIPREIVDLLVEAGAKDDSPQGLHRAVEAAHVGAVKAVLAAGVDPQAPHFTANAPNLALTRCFFTATPDMDVAAALLDGGADLGAIDNRTLDALNYAAANAPVDVVAWLLDRGANTARGGAVWTAVLQAVNKGRMEVVELLHARGANLDEPSSVGFSPLALAIQRKQTEAMEWLLAHDVDVNAGTFTPLMAAAIDGDVALIDRLLALGADPQCQAANPFDRDTVARTAQAHAEAKGNTAAAARLAEASGGGFTTVHPAIEADDLETLRQMLDDGADIEARGARGGERPLHAAASRSLAMVQLLLERGADPNGTNNHGVPPLFSACSGRDDDAVDRVRALLDAGADAKKRVKTGGSALETAVVARNLGTVRLLLDAGAPVENKRKRIHQPLHLAAAADDVEMLELLWTKKPRLEPIATTIHGGQHTPLHMAADRNAARAIGWLLAKGANADHPGEWKTKNTNDNVYWEEGEWTPIHVAAAAGSFDALVALLADDRSGARFLPTAANKYAGELAEEHPRCARLLELMDAKTSIDQALAALDETQRAAEAAEASGAFWVERITEEIAEGTAQAPPAVKNALKPHDWVRTLPVDGAVSLVLRFERGLHEVAVGDADGIHALPVVIRGQRIPYAISPDGRQFLVSDRNAVFHIDASDPTSPTVRNVASDLEGEVRDVGLLADGACLVLTESHLSRYDAREQPAAATWRMDATGLREVFCTGSDSVGLLLHNNVLQLVWACAAADGLRLHSTLPDSVALLWTRREPDGSLGGIAYSHWNGPRVYRLHHVEGIAPTGAPVTTLPGAQDANALPRLKVLASDPR